MWVRVAAVIAYILLPTALHAQEKRIALLIGHNVRVAVVDNTKGDQVPWTEDGIQRRQRVLFGGEATPPPSSQARAMRRSMERRERRAQS
jgi:hypothetical protein